MLEKKLASADVSEEEQKNLLKDLERKETEYMRLKRNKICANDFDLLTIIGRGAFGEVRDMHVSYEKRKCLFKDFIFFPQSLKFPDVKISWFCSFMCLLLASVLSLLFHSKAYILQVRLCREKKSGDIYAMKKLKKSEMLSRGQVRSEIIKIDVFYLF